MKNYCLITQLMDEFVNKPAIFNITTLNQVTVSHCDLGQISRGWSSFVEYNQVLRSVTGGGFSLRCFICCQHLIWLLITSLYHKMAMLSKWSLHETWPSHRTDKWPEGGWLLFSNAFNNSSCVKIKTNITHSTNTVKINTSDVSDKKL